MKLWVPTLFSISILVPRTVATFLASATDRPALVSFGTSASGGLPPFYAVPQIRHNNPHDGGSLGCHMHMLECIAALIPWNWVEMSVCLCLKLTAPFRSTLLQRSRGNFWCLKCYVAVIFCFSCASCFLKLAKQIKF